MDTDKLYKKIGGEVKKQAQLAARRWGGILDEDDIVQGIWLGILESDYDKEYLMNAGEAHVKLVLHRRADRVCGKEKTDHARFMGDFRYTPANVRKSLELYFQDGRSLEFNTHVAITQNIAELMKSSQDYYDMVVARYRDGHKPENKHEENALYRGVDKLTELMNEDLRNQRNQYNREHGIYAGPYDPDTIADPNSDLTEEIN